MFDFERQATGNLGAPGSVYQGGRRQHQQAAPVNDVFGSTVAGLAKLATGIGEQKFISAAENEYMRGARARHLGEAFEDIESNIFARPFLRGGFQDHDYRIRQAEMAQETQAFISKEGRKMAPEDFQKEFLAKRADELFAQVGSGMSATGRANMLDSQMKLEETLVREHAKEYQEYGLQEAGKRVSSEVNSVLASMQTALARGYDLQPYAEQLSGIIDSLHSTFPHEMANVLTVDMMKAIYGDGHYEVGNMLNDAINRTGALAELPLGKQHEIGKAKAAARSATQFRRSADVIVKYNEYLQRNKEGIPLDPSEVYQFVQDNQGTFLTEAHVVKLMQLVANDPKVDKNRIGAELFFGRDTGGLNKEQISIKAAGQSATELAFARFPDSPREAVPLVLAAAFDMGTNPKLLTEKITESWNALSTTEDWTGLEYHSEMMSAVVDSVQVLDANKRTGAIVQLSRDLPEEMRPVIRNLVNRESGVSLQDAVRASLDQAADKTLYEATPVANAALTGKMQEEVRKLMTPGMIVSGWRKFKDATGLGAAMPQKGSVGFNILVDEVERRAATLAADPMNARRYDAEYIAAWAHDDVLARTIFLRPESGNAVPLVMPEVNGRVTFKEELFNTVDANGNPILSDDGERGADNAQIAQALQALYKPAGKGQQVVFEHDAGGAIYVSQQDKETQRIVFGSRNKVDAQDVARWIRKDLDSRVKETVTAEYGDLVQGIPDGAGGKVDLRMSGQNTTGIRSDKVLEWRKSLVPFEGYKQVTYMDTTGNVTAGVGHKLPKGTPVGEPVTAAQIEEWYLQDTDKAIQVATTVAQDYGNNLEDDAETMLAIAGAAFQLGESGLRKFDESLQIIAEARDYDALVRNSQEWLWTQQTPKRVEDFLKRVKGRFDAYEKYYRP